MADPVTRKRWARIRIIAFWWFAALIITASLIPAGHIPQSGLSDKSGHVLAYTILTVLGLYAYPGHALKVLLGVCAIGLAVEVTQYITPTRHFEWLDIVANGTGLLLGFLGWRVFRRRSAN